MIGSSIIANDQGNRTTPSYVGFTDTERLIGDAAKNQVAMNPVNTVFGECSVLGLVQHEYSRFPLVDALRPPSPFSGFLISPHSRFSPSSV